jgi:hypothetical protein
MQLSPPSRHSIPLWLTVKYSQFYDGNHEEKGFEVFTVVSIKMPSSGMYTHGTTFQKMIFLQKRECLHSKENCISITKQCTRYQHNTTLRHSSLKFYWQNATRPISFSTKFAKHDSFNLTVGTEVELMLTTTEFWGFVQHLAF